MKKLFASFAIVAMLSACASTGNKAACPCKGDTHQADCAHCAEKAKSAGTTGDHKHMASHSDEGCTSGGCKH